MPQILLMNKLVNYVSAICEINDIQEVVWRKDVN